MTWLHLTTGTCTGSGHDQRQTTNGHARRVAMNTDKVHAWCRADRSHTHAVQALPCRLLSPPQPPHNQTSLQLMLQITWNVWNSEVMCMHMGLEGRASCAGSRSHILGTRLEPTSKRPAATTPQPLARSGNKTSCPKLAFLQHVDWPCDLPPMPYVSDTMVSRHCSRGPVDFHNSCTRHGLAHACMSTGQVQS